MSSGLKLFADQQLDVANLPSLRAENFPYSGPYPWLDQPDSLNQIETRLRRKRLTPYEAEQCRFWHKNGYIILPKLISNEILDNV